MWNNHNYNVNDSSQTNHDNGDNQNNDNNCANGDNYDKRNIVGHAVFFLTVLQRQLRYVWLSLLFVASLCIHTYIHFTKAYYIKVEKFIYFEFFVSTIGCRNASICRFINRYVRTKTLLDPYVYNCMHGLIF